MTAREILDRLPNGAASACVALFNKLPIEDAMAATVVHKGKSELYPLVETAIQHADIENNPALIAGLWIYVDELDKSHAVSQGLNDTTGSYWHAIMHRREGDFGNSKYWLRQAGHHEACADTEGYDPVRLVDMAEDGDEEVPNLQRKEWAALFVWCARHLQ